MSRIAYVNGQYLPLSCAMVHVEDRGYQFSDAVYEVVLVRQGVFVDFQPHIDRLNRSLGVLRITPPFSNMHWELLCAEMVRRNRLRDGIVYIQVSRGVARRDHAFPRPEAQPSVVMTAKRLDFSLIRKKQEKGISIITGPETRWARPDVKSVSLLPNVLAKQEAVENNAQEYWFVDREGFITEGTSSNAWIIKNGIIQTRNLGTAILPGITRQTLIGVLKAEGLDFRETAFTREEALSADEAFISSSTNFAMPVVMIDGQKIGSGIPGPLCQKLISAYWNYIQKAKFE